MIFAQDLVILFPNKENWGFKSPFIKLLKVRLICVDLHAKNLSVLCLTVGCKWPNMHMIVRGCKLRCTSLFGLATVRMKMLNIFINCCFLSLVISSRLKDLICPLTWHLDWPAAQKEERKKKKTEKKQQKNPNFALLRGSAARKDCVDPRHHKYTLGTQADHHLCMSWICWWQGRCVCVDGCVNVLWIGVSPTLLEAISPVTQFLAQAQKIVRQ